MIPYGRQEVVQSDIDAVVDVLQSDFLTQGPQVPKFEQAVAAYCGAKEAVAVNSATSALHIACLALGLGEGDWLWTSPNTFVASANCGLYCGASVDFVDIDPESYNLCPVALAQKLQQAEAEDRLPKVLMVVHFSGQPCDMQSISKLSECYGFRIIEDASHAIGARYEGESVGNGRFSDITVFSFHPVKIITAAEGGMAVTNDDDLAERMRLLRSHGVTRDEHLMTGEPDGPWYYQQVDLGFNYRLNDLQAALGLSQLERLDRYVEQRRSLAHRYNELLREVAVATPQRFSHVSSAWHLYVVRVPEKSHRQVFERLRADGIGVNLHYIPVHTQPYYQKLGFKAGDFPNAEQYYREAISLPLYPTLSHEQQDQVVEVLKRALAS